jgi:hypothetical protein
MDLNQFLPPLPIWTALIAAGLMPLLLAVFSRGKFSALPPGKRFWLTLATSFVFWLSIIIFGLTDIDSNSVKDIVFDLLAGMAIVLTSGLVLYSVWSLACFGFTTTMLTSIDDSSSPLTAEQWANLYGDGHGMQAFTNDRIRVLLAMKLVRENQGRLFLSGSAAMQFSRLVKLSFRVFAVRLEK